MQSSGGGNWPQFPFSGCSKSSSACSSDSLFARSQQMQQQGETFCGFWGAYPPFIALSPEDPIPTSPSSYHNACINYYFLDLPATCCQMLLQHFLLAALTRCSVLHMTLEEVGYVEYVIAVTR